MPIRNEGDSLTGDQIADEDGVGIAYDLYKNVFLRNSIDDRGVNDAQGITHLMNHNISLLAALPVMNNRLSNYS
jgi:hypothetical protein